MEKRKMNKLVKSLQMKNLKELKKDIKAFEEFYFNNNYDYQEQGPIVYDNFCDILHMCKIETFNKKEIIEIIKEAVSIIESK